MSPLGDFFLILLQSELKEPKAAGATRGYEKVSCSEENAQEWNMEDLMDNSLHALQRQLDDLANITPENNVEF